MGRRRGGGEGCWRCFKVFRRGGGGGGEGCVRVVVGSQRHVNGGLTRVEDRGNCAIQRLTRLTSLHPTAVSGIRGNGFSIKVSVLAGVYGALKTEVRVMGR